jgi:hypothetical protein
MRPRRAARWLGLGLGTLLLAGCQLYWVKPGADMTAFTRDHQACVKTAGVPPGYFRGQESEGPVALNEVPEQTPTMERR